jgi:hypothetical protein
VRSYLENSQHKKRADGVAQVDPEFKPQYCKKRKRKLILELITKNRTVK